MTYAWVRKTQRNTVTAFIRTVQKIRGTEKRLSLCILIIRRSKTENTATSKRVCRNCTCLVEAQTYLPYEYTKRTCLHDNQLRAKDIDTHSCTFFINRTKLIAFKIIHRMQKYIFLDIDGVLATPDYVKDGMWALNPEKQKILSKILKQTDAKIVLSSSWRHATLEDTKVHMKNEGFLFIDELIGITIRAYHYLEKGTKIHLSIPRGVEIKQWLDANVHSNNGKDWRRKRPGIDFTYLILDDDTDMLLEHKDNFIHTDGMKGLTNDDVEHAVMILNNCD